MGDLTAHWKSLYDNKFLGAWSLYSPKRKGYFEVTVRIDRVTQEEVVGEGGRTSWPILLYLSGPKSKLPAPMIVSKTSGRSLEIMFGESPAGWVGHEITLYVRKDKKVRMGTGSVLCIRCNKGNQDLKEELQRRTEPIDEEEFGTPHDADGVVIEPAREPGVD